MSQIDGIIYVWQGLKYTYLTKSHEYAKLLHTLTASQYPMLPLPKNNKRSFLIKICDALRDLVIFKNMKNTHGGVLLLVNLRASACNFTKRNAPPWVFFTFFKLYKSRNTPLCEQICKNSGWKTFYLLGHSFRTLHKYVCVRNQGVRNISFSDNFAHVPLCAVSHIVTNLPQNTNFRNNLKMQIIWNSNGRHKYGQLFDKKDRRV